MLPVLRDGVFLWMLLESYCLIATEVYRREQLVDFIAQCGGEGGDAEGR